MSRWPTTDLRPAVAACGAFGALLAAAFVHARGATERADASATVVTPGRLTELLGNLPGAVVRPDGAALIVVMPATAPAVAAVAAVRTAAPDNAAAPAAGAGTAPAADGTLRGDIVVAVTAAAPAGAAPAAGEAVNVIVAFN